MRPRERARLVACVPQRVDAVFDMQVRALVLMGRYPHTGFLGGYSTRDQEVAEAAMRGTGVFAFRNRKAGQLSGGEFQRVLMARALAQETELLFLDEAGSGLDIGHKVEIYDLVRQRNRQGSTVLSVIHDLNLAAAYCDRLIFLKDGRVVEDGPTRTVFTEQILSRVYETDVLVAAHPGTGVPQCFLVPGSGVPVSAAG
jgi:iron complex transport system ATP-binding protein